MPRKKEEHPVKSSTLPESEGFTFCEGNVFFNSQGTYGVHGWRGVHSAESPMVCAPGTTEWYPSNLLPGRDEIAATLHGSGIHHKDALVIVSPQVALHLLLGNALSITEHLLADETVEMFDGTVHIPVVKLARRLVVPVYITPKHEAPQITVRRRSDAVNDILSWLIA